jgi:EmrB/QacA subfamily drug resistance transporter
MATWHSKCSVSSPALALGTIAAPYSIAFRGCFLASEVQNVNYGRRWLVLAVLSLALFMLLLDSTIVNIAVPDIIRSLNASVTDIEWVIDAYLLGFAVLLIAFGRLGDLFGRKRLFMVGLIVFTVSSATCGFAPNEIFLIISRVAQAIGGSMMMPQTLSNIRVIFPPVQRGVAMGIWGAVAGAATALGPTIGGVLVQFYSWRWIFFVNVPVGIVAVVAAWLLIKENKIDRPERVDFPGLVLVSLAMFCLVFALIEGVTYGWGSTLIITMLVAAGALFVVFVIVERSVAQPLVDLSLFRNRTFSAGNYAAMSIGFGLLGVLFLLTLFLQIVLGFGALEAGLTLTASSGMVMIVAPLAGRAAGRFGSRWLVFAGLLLCTIGVLFLTRISLTTTWQSLVGPLVIVGIGVGLTQAPTTTAVISAAPAQKTGNASGILTTARQVGAVFGISVLGAVLQNSLIGSLTNDIGNMPIPAAAKAQIIQQFAQGGINFTTGTAPSISGPFGAAINQAFRQDLVPAINLTFFVAAIVTAVGAFVALLMCNPLAAEARATKSGEAGAEQAANTGC